MTLYPQVLVVHNLATLLLIGGLLLLTTALLGLRGQTSLERIRRWSGVARIGERSLMVGAVTLLLSGLYLMALVWKLQQAWVNLSLLVTLLLVAAVRLWIAPRLGVLWETAQAEEGISRVLALAIHDPALWTSVALVLCGSLGVWLLMVLKPSGLLAFLVLLLALLVGLGLAMLFYRKEEP